MCYDLIYGERAEGQGDSGWLLSHRRGAGALDQRGSRGSGAEQTVSQEI